MSEYPKKLSKGSFRVNVTYSEKGKYRVQYSIGRKSFQYRRDTEVEALMLAETKLEEIYAAGLKTNVTLTTKNDWLDARECLDDSGLRGTVSSYVREFVKEHDRIEEHNGTIGEAVSMWIRTHSTTESKPIREAGQAFLDSKQGLSNDYVYTLKSSLEKLIWSCVAENVDDITPADFAGLKIEKLAPKTRNHVRAAIRTFLEYCKVHRWLAQDFDFAALLKPERIARGAVEIWTPEEFASVLERMPERLTAPLAVSGFAGIRIEEIQKLDWKDFSFERQSITISAENSKTNRRRIVPMSDNLIKWLEPFRNVSGPFVTYKRLRGSIYDNARLRKIKWKKNASRHSYISYRLEIVMSADQVSLEAGNSPQEIFEHYRELVTKEAAETWFSIVPAAAGNVVKMVG